MTGQPIQTGKLVLWQTGQTIKTTAIGGRHGTAYPDGTAVHGADGTAYTEGTAGLVADGTEYKDGTAVPSV